MVTSISDREPQVSSGASELTDSSLKITVTGVDQKGQMFREISEVLALEGRNCRFRSKFQPELGSWVLVEINYSIAGKKPCSLQGEVKSVQNEGAPGNLNQIQVELEMAQDVKFASSSDPVPGKTQKGPLAAVPQAKIEPKETPKTAAPVAVPTPLKTQSVQAKPPVEIPAPKVQVPARETSVPVRVETPAPDREAAKSETTADLNQRMEVLKNSLTKELEQKVQVAIAAGVQQAAREAAKSEITADLNQRMETLKNSLTKELEQKVQVAVAAGVQQAAHEAAKSETSPDLSQQMETMKNSLTKELEQKLQVAVASSIPQAANQAVEKQISERYQATIQTLNSDLIHQLVSRLAENQELRASLEKMAKDVLEEQSEQSRDALVSAQKSMESRAMEIIGTLEESMGASEKKVNAAREGISATLETMQTRETEASQRLQENLEKLDDLAKSMMEKFNSQMTAQLNSWSAQFKSHLDRVSSERAAQYAREMDENLPAYVRNADETMGKISAGLQLLQGTARLQEERLAELTRTAAADFEKEIKAVLLRLAGTV